MLDREPPRDAALTIAIECWFDLDSERPSGMDEAGAIPYRAIRAWVRDQGLDREWLLVLADVIRHNDVIRAERIEAERKAAEARAKAKGNKR